DGSFLSAHAHGLDVFQSPTRQAGRPEVARVPAVRSEPRGPTGGPARRSWLPPHPGAHRGPGARQSELERKRTSQMRFRSPAPGPVAAVAGVLLSLSLLLGASPAAAQADKVAHGLALQAARAKFVVVKAKKVFYTKRWDLGGLPVYRPQQQVSGTIRMWGSNYIQDSDLGKYWEEGFRKYQPGAHSEFHMKSA